MAESILIYGKDTWPFTIKAREAYQKEGKTVDYFNVIIQPDKLSEMLVYSKGIRKIPVIVEKGKVMTGFGGSW